ncbi:MAG: sigma-70 family RNA polymerase sigma factor [Actinomycetota bacterium]
MHEREAPLAPPTGPPSALPPAARPGDDLDELLGAVARGDQGAFDQMYRLLRPSVYRRVRAVLRDQAQSEEVAQEVMLEIWSNAVRYDPARGSAAAWVMTIAHRRAVDRVRSVAAAADRDRRGFVPAALWDRVGDAAADAADRERLIRCLDQLSGRQREAITLAFYGGHSYRQVAGILGAPVGTVKSRIRDGLIQLRNSMLADQVDLDRR